MICAWEPLQAVLPPEIQKCLTEESRLDLQEIRLRTGSKPELRYGNRARWMGKTVTRENLSYIVSAASRYSPWLTETLSSGYLSLPGGHRIGICGNVLYSGGIVKGIRDPDSMCIRIARDVQGIAKPYAAIRDSVLIIGAPGWGKTTLLRDLAREIASTRETVVVDERGELFPEGFRRGTRMDVLGQCPKAQGVEMALRTMGPEVIAVDEITSERDSEVLGHAANCGVTLLATAHASSLEDLYKRRAYRVLLEHAVFQSVLILSRDKSCQEERMERWH